MRVAVPLGKGGDYNSQFKISKPWTEGQYPLRCSVGSAIVYQGQVKWTPPPTAASWESTNAKISDVKTVFVSKDAGNLILTVSYQKPAASGTAAVRCFIRQDDLEGVQVYMTVALSTESDGGTYLSHFDIHMPWDDGQYPVRCWVGVATVFEGQVQWSSKVNPPH